MFCSNGGYNTCIYREDQYTAFIDITTTPEGYSKLLRYITDRTAYSLLVILNRNSAKYQNAENELNEIEGAECPVDIQK